MLFEKIKLIDENFEIKENMYLQTQNDTITYIGDKPPKNYLGEKIKGKGKLLAPGFYNTHCHVPMTLLRGYGEDLPLDRWLHEKMFPFEAKLTPTDIYYGTLLGIMEMISSGVVSFSDMYFNILDIAKACTDAGIKANISHGLAAFSDDTRLKNLSGYKDTLSLIEYAKDTTGLIIADCGLHAEYTSLEHFVKEVAEFAKSNNLIVHTHISESESEHNDCKKRHSGRTPVKYFKDCGIFENRVQAAHCIYIEDEDAEIIKNSDSSISHCISSNLKLGSGIAPIYKFHNMGINVVTATDGAASNNNLNILEESHIAALVAKSITKNPLALNAVTVLKMGTINGARAQGRYNCGCLKTGNKADMIMFDLDKPHLTPDHDTISNIIYSAQHTDVCMNMINGKIVYKDGEFLTVDAEKIKREVITRQERIVKQLQK